MSNTVPGDSGSSSLLFRPMALDREGEVYRSARRDAWLAVYPDLLAFDGPGFLEEAREQQLWDPRALRCVVLDGQIIGILQLATLSGARAGVGHVPFLWVREDFRRQGLGSLLLKQAEDTYHSMGRKVLRLQCSPANRPARQFYRAHGFVKIGQVPGAQEALDLLEKEI